MESEIEYCKKINESFETKLIKHETLIDIINEMKNTKLNDIIKYKTKIIDKMDDEFFINFLLEYEFYNMNIEKKKLTFDEYIENCRTILNRYTHKAGGWRLEDPKWITHVGPNSETDCKYDLQDYEALFENTILSCFDEDNETNRFIHRLDHVFNTISDDFCSSCIFIRCGRMDVSWLIFVIKKKFHL